MHTPGRERSVRLREMMKAEVRIREEMRGEVREKEWQ